MSAEPTTADIPSGHDHEPAEPESFHEHRHARFNLGVALFGGILLINSWLATKIFYEDEFLGTLSAVAGALLLAAPILWTAVRDMLRGHLGMDVLVALGLMAAIVTQNYTEAGVIAFFMLIAITIEQRTAKGAQKSIEGIVSLTPQTARRVKDDGTEEDIGALDLKVGDVVRVRPGENFPADGIVTKGLSTVNQASITGESLPVDKDVDAEVYAGTENLTGLVEVKVTGIGEDTTLGKVRDLIEAAEKTRLPILRIIDQYLVYYTPAIVMVALIVWFITEDLMRFVYVMVIACPCALVIATPSAVVAAIAAAARLGMLIKNVAHIELAAKIRAVVFDKTGTLTEGKLEVARLGPSEGVELTDLLSAAAAAESQSNHPAAVAIQRLAEKADVKVQIPSKFEEVPGKGVIATVGDTTYRVGRESWFVEEALPVSKQAEDFRTHEDNIGTSVVFVAKGRKVLGWIGMRDGIRAAAQPAVQKLEELGIRQCSMVTGDNESVAKTVAHKIGIREISAECLPEGKVAYVESLRAKGYTVAVIGDGVNDAPALAAGDIGIAMGAIGSDVAINSASIALMNDDLRRVPLLIELTRKTRGIINMNLGFGLAMIVGGIMFFIFGNDAMDSMASWLNVQFPWLKLSPTIMKSTLAAILHIFGTLFVVFNSARLVRFGEQLEPLEKK